MSVEPPLDVPPAKCLDTPMLGTDKLDNVGYPVADPEDETGVKTTKNGNQEENVLMLSLRSQGFLDGVR